MESHHRKICQVFFKFFLIKTINLIFYKELKEIVYFWVCTNRELGR